MKQNKTESFYVFYSKLKIIASLCLVFSLGLLIGLNLNSNTVDHNEYEIIISHDVINDEFSPQKLIAMLEDLNVKYPHIVFAQSMIETGHWTSPLFIENSNLFGMKQAKRRVTSALGTKNGHAYYDHWRDSVYDYAFYQSKYLSKAATEEEYLAYLGRSYAEAGHYVNALRRIINREDLKSMFI